MIREIVKDPLLLSRKCASADIADIPIGRDLLDTLAANSERCVGMAANMIGECKRIIAFDNDGVHTLMYNPQILKASEEYEAEEGCLSLTGTRRVKRFKRIKVQYYNEDFKLRIKSFSGWTAQIIQHEIDHCNSILI